MKISTRGRYAIRVMIDLAEHGFGEYIPLTDIAKRQDISEKYLEAIVASLVKAGLLVGLRGKKGGYRLTKQPEEYTLYDILKITEGSFAPVSCLETEVNTCPRAAECKTLDIWKNFERLIEDYFQGIKLDSLTGNDDCYDYVI